MKPVDRLSRRNARPTDTSSLQAVIFDVDQPVGLAGRKTVVIASARGGFYAGTARAGADFQEAYLGQVFGFLGIDDVRVVRAEGIGLGAEQRAAALAAAHADIAESPLSRAA